MFKVMLYTAFSLLLIAGGVWLYYLNKRHDEQRSEMLKDDIQVSQFLPYKKNTDFLSHEEFVFYMLLRDYFEEKFAISMRTRLWDILSLPGDTQDAGRYRAAAMMDVADFLLVDKDSAIPKVVVKMVDTETQDPDEKRRLEFLKAALFASGIPLVTVKPDVNYPKSRLVEEIRKKSAA